AMQMRRVVLLIAAAGFVVCGCSASPAAPTQSALAPALAFEAPALASGDRATITIRPDGPRLNKVSPTSVTIRQGGTVTFLLDDLFYRRFCRVRLSHSEFKFERGRVIDNGVAIDVPFLRSEGFTVDCKAFLSET